jgi:hypothetical protein
LVKVKITEVRAFSLTGEAIAEFAAVPEASAPITSA